MTAKTIYNSIETAIDTNSEIKLSVKHGLGSNIDNTLFQPYILGDDTYQYSFVWGYLPGLNLYYKFRLTDILSADLLQTKFNVREDACYQYAIEEDHFAKLSGFTNIYLQAAKTAPKQGFKVHKFIHSLGGNTWVCHVAACSGVNKNTGEKGFIAYGYDVNLDTRPTDTKNAKMLVDTLFETEAQAIKEGEKIMKGESKANYDWWKASQKKGK